MADGGDDKVAGEAAPVVDSTDLDELTSVVVKAARFSASGDWGQKPRLYALARTAEWERSGESLPDLAAEDALILVEQAPLPPGDPAEVLARIQWPAAVAGCVLVTEVTVGDNKDGGTASTQNKKDALLGRLTVGVLRDGEYACCLQFLDELIIGPDLADDLVTALLSTL